MKNVLQKHPGPKTDNLNVQINNQDLIDINKNNLTADQRETITTIYDMYAQEKSMKQKENLKSQLFHYLRNNSIEFKEIK